MTRKSRGHGAFLLGLMCRDDTSERDHPGCMTSQGIEVELQEVGGRERCVSSTRFWLGLSEPFSMLPDLCRDRCALSPKF